MTADTTEQPHPAAPELASLRKAIDAIDHDMVALLKERQEQVDRVVALKRTHGLPVYHPAREENLISEKRRTARAVGRIERSLGPLPAIEPNRSGPVL